MDIFGVITKLNYLGVISIHLSALSRIGIFFFWGGGVAKFSNINNTVMMNYGAV